MKCVVINGTEIRGCTYHLKELFLDELKPEALTEFYLPKDAPGYCIGCKRCFLESEAFCPHFEKVDPIWRAMKEADLLVFAYPVYVLRAPGQLKSLLDHLGVHWFAHRPDPVMFSKSAVIITQSIVAPNGAAQKDVMTSLQWLGVASVERIGFGLMEGVHWDEISEKRRQRFESKIRGFARRFRDVSPKQMSLRAKFYFAMCHMIQNGVRKRLAAGEKPGVDLQYWTDRGWVSER